MNSTKPTTIDEYLASLPDDARTTLSAMRAMVRAAAPDAVESISYGIPTFKHKGRPLFYMAALKHHCAVYGMNWDKHQDEIAGYELEKGTLRFPKDKPLPETLVRSLVNERMAEIEAASAERKAKRSHA